MSKPRIAGALLAAAFLAWAGTAAAQQGGTAGPDSARLVEEVAGLRDSLERLAALLERATDQQKIDLLLKRIELKERRMIPVATDLRTLEGQYEDQKAVVKRYQEMLDQMEDVVSNEVRRGVDQPDSEARRSVTEIERELQIEVTRIEDLERRMRRLEDELDQGRREVAILDERLQDLLDE